MYGNNSSEDHQELINNVYLHFIAILRHVTALTYAATAC